MVNLNIKDQFVPAYTFGEPNQPVAIAKDEALLMDTNGTVILDGDVEVRLDLLPDPDINMYFTTKERLEDSEGKKLLNSLIPYGLLKLTNNERQIKVYPRNIRLPASGGYSLVLFTDSEPIIGVGDDTTEIHHIVFHPVSYTHLTLPTNREV